MDDLLIAAAGWSGVILSLTLGVLALVWRNASTMLMGAVVAVPFCLYLSGTPRFGIAAVIAAGAYFGGVVALRRQQPGLAAASIVPLAALASWIALSVTGGW